MRAFLLCVFVFLALAAGTESTEQAGDVQVTVRIQQFETRQFPSLFSRLLPRSSFASSFPSLPRLFGLGDESNDDETNSPGFFPHRLFSHFRSMIPRFQLHPVFLRPILKEEEEREDAVPVVQQTLQVEPADDIEELDSTDATNDQTNNVVIQDRNGKEAANNPMPVVTEDTNTNTPPPVTTTTTTTTTAKQPQHALNQRHHAQLQASLFSKINLLILFVAAALLLGFALFVRCMSNRNQEGGKPVFAGDEEAVFVQQEEGILLESSRQALFANQ